MKICKVGGTKMLHWTNFVLCETVLTLKIHLQLVSHVVWAAK